VAQERKRQVRGGPDPLDATLGRRDDLLQVSPPRVANSVPLRLAHKGD
jgi:hypothetical protein